MSRICVLVILASVRRDNEVQKRKVQNQLNVLIILIVISSNILHSS